MKEEYIKTLEMFADMRRAQKAYFDARKRNDMISAGKHLELSKRLEYAADKRVQDETDRIKHGEQGVIFK